MKTTTVTQKGQITLPKNLRDMFGITPQTEVSFEATEKGILVTKSPSLIDLAGKFKPLKNSHISAVEARDYMEMDYEK